MTMRKHMLAAVVASLAAAVSAQESVAEAAGEGAAPAPAKVGSRRFTALPSCILTSGGAEVLLPLATAWQAPEEGRFYPLGSRFRTHGDGKLSLAFGPEAEVAIEGESEFAVRAQAMTNKARTIELCRGSVRVALARNTTPGAFFVDTPGLTVRNLAGESRYVCEDRGDGVFVSVRCVTGTLGVGGLHFDIPELHAADELHVRTSRDDLVTFLYGVSGDFVAKIDRGLVNSIDIGESGERKNVIEKSVLEWRLSPETKVRIDRIRSTVDGPMSVSVMAFDAAGVLKHNFAFAEGRSDVNSGELVVAPKPSADDAAASAAEATETVAADVEESAATDDGAADGKNAAKTDEEA